jgi:hypothetical protein
MMWIISTNLIADRTNTLTDGRQVFVVVAFPLVSFDTWLGYFGFLLIRGRGFEVSQPLLA